MTAPTPKDLFNAALELPPAERAGYLDRACAGDAALRQRVERLLHAHDAGPEFLGAPTADLGAATVAGDTLTLPAMPRTPAEAPGSRIGPYKLLQQIGEGGFGVVFMAEQERPVQRRVALKIIKLGMDTRQVVARFEQERQALAMMDHPNIARVLDAGATEAGRPYFVMELVKGEPVTDYCDRHQLTIADRLGLFAQVCFAVQHAHTKGVIHRDIKPSNVLVSTQDGRPHAKVIDFGIAKATQQRLTQKTLFTEHQQLIGTPEYMSPEQAEGSLDIDTRTDVYSLGVLLYELLTGTTPFDGRKLRSAAYAELQRIIREDEPPRPSTRLSQHATLAEIAARRQVEPRRLGVLLKGDLDWVVMKALEKDRARRYDSPGALAQDLSRYLDGRPVEAAPPGAAYRARKFIRRHRGPVIAASLVGGALLAGAAMASVGYFSAVRARDAEVLARQAEQARAAQLERQKVLAEAARVEAEKARAQAESARSEAEAARVQAETARAQEEAQRHRAETVAKFLERVLQAADPTVAGVNRDVTVREVLDDAARQLEAGDLSSEPLSEVEARRALAKTYTLLGAFDRADALLKRAQAVADATPGVPATSRAELAAAWSTLQLEQGQLQASLESAQRAVELFNRELGPDHPSSIAALRSVALTLLDLGRTDEATKIADDALARSEAQKPLNPALLTESLETVARAATMQGRHADAERADRRAIEISRAHGDDTAVLHELNNLAVSLVDLGRFAEAGEAFREAYELAQRVMDADHPLLARMRSNYCTILAHEGKIEEAETILVDAARQARVQFGPENPRLAGILHNLGAVQERAGKPEAAEATYRECLKIREAAGLGGHIDQANTASSLALALFRGATPERLAEAERLLRMSLDIRARELPPGDPMIGVARTFLGSCLVRQAKYAEAEPMLIEGYEGQSRVAGIDDEGRANTIDTIIKMYERWEAADPGKGHGDKAGPWREQLSRLTAPK